MSLNITRKDSSQSESSTSSSNQGLVIFQDDIKPISKNEFLLLDATASMLLSRTGTVRRANSFRRDSTKSISNEDIVRKIDKIGEPEKLRRSLDIGHRHSLESISEYKAKHSFSGSSFFQTRTSSSIDSPYSDCTDYATKISTEPNKPDNQTVITPGSSYLSWIESVQNEYFGKNADVSDTESKVGEWNNFWLNYQNSRTACVSRLSSVYCKSVSQYSGDEKIGDQLSDARSSCSTQKDFTDKNFTDSITLSVEDASEILKYSQRISEIMLGAIKKTEGSGDYSRNGSLHSSLSHQTSIKDEARERSFSYTSNTDLQRQKFLLKTTNPPQQSTSSSCINAILNTGVADYLKRVINKKRDVNDSSYEAPKTRHSFSEWSIK